MSDNLSEELSQLINYLDEHSQVKKPPPVLKKQVEKEKKIELRTPQIRKQEEKVLIVHPEVKKQKSSSKSHIKSAIIFNDKPTEVVKLNKPPTDVPSNGSGFNVKQFEEIMRSKLIDDYKRNQSYERPYISVSELYQCMRKNYYSRMKYHVDVRSQYGFAYLDLISHIGTEVHKYIQGIYNFTNIEKVVLSEKYKVKGRVDACNEGFVIELKTIDDQKFSGTYLPEHYAQGNIYSYILNSEYGSYNIHTITIVYILRNLKKVIPFDCKVNEKEAIRYLNNSIILRKHIQEKTVPPPLEANMEQCKYCSYRNYCEKEDSQSAKNQSKKSETAFLL